MHTTLLRLWPLITIVKATYACECDESKPMNPQELLALNDFLKQLSDVRGVQKDAQVDLLINQAVAQQPDAAYLLVQRSMLLDIALNNAKAQITQLESTLATTRQALQTKPGTSNASFLSAENSWGNSAPTSTPLPSNPALAAAANTGFLGGGMGGMLGTVAATAAGVAGGAFLYQGLQHLMHPPSNGLNPRNENTTQEQSSLLNQDGASSAGMQGFSDMQPSEQVLASPSSSVDLDNSADGSFDSGFDGGSDMST